MNAHEIAAKLALIITPVGSRVTVDPPPIDTDADYLVFVERAMWATARNILIDDQWDVGGSDVGDGSSDGWESWRKADENIILVWHKPLHDCFLASTAIAKALNLREKADRKMLFATLEKHWPDAIVTPKLGDDAFLVEEIL